MAEDTTASPAAPIAEVPPAPLTRRQICILWGDAATDEARKQLVTKYPVLREIYSEAQNY